MRYTVTWHPDASDDLANLWMAAGDRRAVANAANRIDRELAVDPERKGHPYYGDWILVIEPLAVVYAVYPDDRIVDVLQISVR